MPHLVPGQVQLVPARTHYTAEAACPDGETVISGGFDNLNFGSGQLSLIASYPVDNTNSFALAVRNESEGPDTFLPWAYCLPPA
jgi:hypothetical protein